MRLPPPLLDLALERLRCFEEQVSIRTDTLSPLALIPRNLPGHFPRHALRVWACSDFVANTCIRNPMLALDLIRSADLLRTYPPDHYRQQCRRALSPVSDEQGLFAALRRVREREMVRIAWRDLAEMADLNETMGDLSRFAAAVIDEALGKLYGIFGERFGVPHSPAGEPQRLVVLGMGKLGGEELNFSSDVDLIFAYPGTSHTQAARTGADHAVSRRARARGGLSNEEFFIRLGRRLVQLLGQTTEDGLVFRVDMRLRPFGNSGPLAGSFDALEDYYQIHGRDWERYALIRARPVAGDIAAGEVLLERLRPFVYRQYLDFGAIDALREMKDLIAREVQRKGYQQNVKLGPGGIREIEFMAQALQMIYGARNPDLRARPTLVVLNRLGGHGYLPEPVVGELSAAYRFLRTLEHRLQEVDDRQTHRIPEDGWARERLAAGMGVAHWMDLSRMIDEHRDNVQRRFDEVFAQPSAPVSVETGPGENAHGQEAPSDTEQTPVHELSGLMRMDECQGIETLDRLGFPDGVHAWTVLQTLVNETSLRFLTGRGRRRLEKLLPLVLQTVADRAGAASATLERVFQVLEAIGRRTVYFALLLENPVVLEQLVRLCAASPWIARQIARFPLLLDELLFPDTLYAPPGVPELKADLKARFARITPGDTEQEMDALRQFKQANVLRIAAADVCRVMPLMEVSDHLTDIAEVCLDAVLGLAWGDLVKHHGQPRRRTRDGGGEEGKAPPPGTEPMGFLIVAYGKLGGFELGYGSDLDLVFLHDSDPGHTDAEKPIENSVFFARLGQRIIHFLSAHTSAGVLYEVDARLRPSGRAGFLVSHMDAFTGYQHREAWTWEHQALVRARPVAGDRDLARRFDGVRADVLRKQRDPGELGQAVCEMRARMRRELDHTRRGLFDLKQGPGGITDIEFIVQYATLRWADRLAEFLIYRDNIRLLEGMAKAGLMAKQDADSLARIYRRYRARVHALALQELPPLVGETAEGMPEDARASGEGIAREETMGDGAPSDGTPSDGTLADRAMNDKASEMPFAEERATVSRVWERLLGDFSSTAKPTGRATQGRNHEE
uniref:Bifunctional glutamine synthetase adenylyltransferase/adenylyl-removing enzyme n=1 Tax=Candidatus Kentrum sp. FM TaxID=2126340 RepID=A0A450TIU9_9GAMM|nr:MAG: glutamate-ammonia-ligase adenylyltransferase [Candidatus Kentron sp. FM]VFJ67234.1 MAG: glutamate-ammonia-ligase adenylyltransferase [Candidatus Kentron sp. FM]VFK16928.1 MAG: glutamate-ammonia-ligase adenylyltransferase [Candidatus Kentron sp. FM]